MSPSKGFGFCEAPVETRECVVCGRVFLPHERGQKCCCAGCSAENKRRKQKAWRASHPVKHVCPVCGTEFEGAPKRVYCSARCRDRKQCEERKAIRHEARERRENAPVSMSGISDVAARAAAAGMSYGAYVARHMDA